MSLAMYAAPFDNDINIVKENDPISRKRALNKTQKRMPSSSSPKENNYSERVNSVLQSIHNLPAEDEPLADFNPPPPPESSGVEQTRLKENSQPSNGLMGMFVGQPSQESNSQYLNDMENGIRTNSGELGSGTVSGDYQRFMPNYSHFLFLKCLFNIFQGNFFSLNQLQSKIFENLMHSLLLPLIF